jgi:broad-specificity NMP kinase
MTDSRLLMRSPRLVELAGPAGVGKSTVVQALRSRTPARPGTIWGLPVLPLLGNGVQLLPTLAGFWWDSRSLLWDESRHMVRLRTLYRRVRTEDTAGAPLLVFDEGPVFALAWLRGFGHESLRRDSSADWWNVTLGQWARTVDVIVVLDASDAQLAQRIKARATWHEVKEASLPEITAWMGRFRTALEWVLAGLSAQRGGPRIVRISTDQHCPESIADQVRSALAQVVYDH